MNDLFIKPVILVKQELGGRKGMWTGINLGTHCEFGSLLCRLDPRESYTKLLLHIPNSSQSFSLNSCSLGDTMLLAFALCLFSELKHSLFVCQQV